MRIRQAGDSALLVETGDTETAHRLHARLLAAGLRGLKESVPGLTTVLVVVDPLVLDLDVLEQTLRGWELAPLPAAASREHVIDVVYDGPDMDAVSQRTGLSGPEIIARHTRPVYDVAFLGFSPGFVYLTGLDGELEVPRLDKPRTRVPPGSVAIAGTMTVIYPSATPGGFHLLGHADICLFDPQSEPPNKFAPGDRIRLRART